MKLQPEFDGPHGPRWATALDGLAESGYIDIAFLEISMQFVGTDRVVCSVVSSWQLNQTTESRAREDLARASRNIDELRRTDSRFAELTTGRRTEFDLVADDDWNRIPIFWMDDRGAIHRGPRPSRT